MCLCMMLVLMQNAGSEYPSENVHAFICHLVKIYIYVCEDNL